MSQVSSNNRRIAKNTLLLYIRMGFVLIIAMYTARVVLDILGEEDFGIYNVVGGIVVMFSFLSRTLASASQRYFAFELGRGDYARLNNVFNINLLLFIIIIAAIVFLSETVGLWFMNTQMTIPPDRISAAFWIYQLSVSSFCLTLIAIPYQAVIISREQMDAYAYIGILEAFLNLIFVLCLRLFDASYDILMVYGIFMFLCHAITNVCYVFIAWRRYAETELKFFWDGKLVREIVSYSGWNLFGAVAGVARSQGINILINMFFNPAINAARGLAYQVNNALNQFSSNFFTAVRPQLTKYYAQDDYDNTMNLVFSSSKMTYYLLLFLAVPVMVFAKELLGIWLVEVPQFTEIFLILVVIVALIDSLSNPLMTLAQATGKVRLYQSVVGGLLLLNLPVSWLFLHFGFTAEYTLYVAIVIAILSLLARLIILKRIASFPIRSFMNKVVFSTILTTVASCISTLSVKHFIYTNCANFMGLLLTLLLSVVLIFVIIAVLGLSHDERSSVRRIIETKFHKKT